MQLHAAILAAAYKVRCVVLPYDSKVLEFARIARNVHIAGPATLDDSASTRSLLANALHGPAPHSPVSGVWTDMTPTAQREAAGAAWRRFVQSHSPFLLTYSFSAASYPCCRRLEFCSLITF